MDGRRCAATAIALLTSSRGTYIVNHTPQWPAAAGVVELNSAPIITGHAARTLSESRRAAAKRGAMAARAAGAGHSKHDWNAALLRQSRSVKKKSAWARREIED